MQSELRRFLDRPLSTEEVRAALDAAGDLYYVYFLLDPSARTFYVGKGRGDRLFSHERELWVEVHPVHTNWKKLNRIARIIASGRVLRYEIDSWHDTEESALRRETELIIVLERADARRLCNSNGSRSRGSPSRQLLELRRARGLKSREERIKEGWDVLVKQYTSAFGPPVEFPENARWARFGALRSALQQRTPIVGFTRVGEALYRVGNEQLTMRDIDWRKASADYRAQFGEVPPSWLQDYGPFRDAIAHAIRRRAPLRDWNDLTTMNAELARHLRPKPSP